MASIRKRTAAGKVRWFAEVAIKGKRRAKTFDTKAEAQAWALNTEQELGKHGGIVSGRTLGEAMVRYAKEVSPTKKGARWEYVRLKKIQRHRIAHTMLHNLVTDDLQEWVDEQGKTLSAATVNRDLTLVSSVLKAARVQWKWMTNEPTKDIRRPKEGPPRDRRISEAEIKLILEALGYEEKMPVVTMRQQIAVAFLLSIETAMRQGELWGLEWRRVHLKERYVVLEETKNGTRRDVPLSKRAIELLQKLPQIKGVVFSACSQATMEVTFRKAVKLAEIKDLHWHDTRHEAITRLARKVSVLDLARIVGHRDLRSLSVYYNATASEIASRLD